MKHIFRFIFGLVGLVLLVIVGIAIYVVVSIYDTTDNTNKEIIDNPKETDYLVNSYLCQCLENTKESEKISFLIDELQMNYLLYSVAKEINISGVNLKSIYSIYNDDGSISLEAPLEAYGFSSCLKAKIKVNASLLGIDIILSEMKVGKLSLNNFIIKKLVLTENNLDTVEKELEKQGLYLNLFVKETDFIIRITNKNLDDTISSIESNEKYLFNGLISELTNNPDLIDFYFNKEDKVGVVLMLHEFANSNPLAYDLQTSTPNITTVKNNVNSLISNGVVNVENISLVFDYLVRGYAMLDDSQKQKIDTIDLSSIEINDKKSYKGIVKRSSTTMADIFLDATLVDPIQIANVILNGYYEVDIKEETLNTLFNSFEFIGKSFAFMDDNASYITISSLYTEIYNDRLDLFLVVDINGFYASFKFSFAIFDNVGAKITLSLSSLSSGSINFSQSATKDIFKYLEQIVNEDYLSVNADDLSISFDFTGFINNDFFKYLIEKNLSNISVYLSENNDGKLIVRFAK